VTSQRVLAAKAEYLRALNEPPHADPLVPIVWVVVVVGLAMFWTAVAFGVLWVLRLVMR
jgi:hypothetical protein